MDGDDVVVGVASAPGPRAGAGGRPGARARSPTVSRSPSPTWPRSAETHLAHAGVGTFYEYGGGDALVALTRDVWRSRGLGDFWMHCLVAEGAFDVAVEPIVSLWDLAALDRHRRGGGRPLHRPRRPPGPAGGSALSTNGRLHDEVLARFR